MKFFIKSTISGVILSDGSLKFVTAPGNLVTKILPFNKTDILNHPLWGGKRNLKQTDISGFVSRFKK